MRLANYLISLPLLAGVAQALPPVSVAQAAAMNPVQATQLLAKANALNLKCSVLAEDQTQGLKDMLARAEISLAEKANVATARKAIAAGRNEGRAGVCDEASRKLVTDVYSAAATAVATPVAPVAAAAEPEPPYVAPEPDDTTLTDTNTDDETVQQRPRTKALAVAKQEPAKKDVAVKPAKPDDKRLASKKPAKAAKGLGSYAAVAERYYVALKCGGLGAGQMNRLYQNVLAEHQSAMAGNKPREVRAMLRAAEARASSQNCG